MADSLRNTDAGSFESEMLDRFPRVAQLDQRVDADLEMLRDILLRHRHVALGGLDPLGRHRAIGDQQQRPLGMWLTNPTMNTVAVSMSIPEARTCRRYSLNF